MFELVRRLSGHTAVYGIGTVAQGLIQFILLPLYTRVLSQEEYGTFALLLSLLTVSEVVFRSGIQFAFLTLYFHQQGPEQQRALGRTAWSVLLVQGAVLLALFLWLGPELSVLAAGEGLPTLPIRLIFLYLFVTTPTTLQLALHRSRDESGSFIALNVGQLTTTLLAIVLLVGVLHQGVTGVFVGYLVSGSLFGFVNAVRLLRSFGLGIEAHHARDLYRLGLSYALANMLSQLFMYSNRWFLVSLGSLREVALYDIGAKLGTLLSLLVVSPFSVAWASGCFAVAESERPRETFANLLTYLVGVLSWVGLVIGLFAREAIVIAAGAPYEPAWRVVPLITAAFVAFGAYAFLTMGPALRKRSIEIVVATAVALVVNLWLNWWLIPSLGMFGAAIAYLLSNAALAVVMYVGAQRCYPVDYQWWRLAKLGAALAASSLLGYLATRDGVGWLALRGMLAVSFPVQLWLLSVFSPRELAALRRLPAALLSRGTL